MFIQSTLDMTISMIICEGVLLNGRVFQILMTLYLVVRIYISTSGRCSSSAFVLSSTPYFMLSPNSILLRGSNYKYKLKQDILKPHLTYFHFTMMILPITASWLLMAMYSYGPNFIPRLKNQMYNVLRVCSLYIVWTSWQIKFRAKSCMVYSQNIITVEF